MMDELVVITICDCGCNWGDMAMPHDVIYNWYHLGLV